MNDVVHNTQDVVRAGKETVAHLKQLALVSPRKRARLLLHTSAESSTHEMLIVFHRASFMPPHRHPVGKSESYHVIEGAMRVCLFDDNGGLSQSFTLSAAEGDFLYRLGANLWHMPVPLTEWLVYHEVYTGPFKKEVDVEFPQWAPDEANPTSVQAFLNHHSLPSCLPPSS